MRSRLQTQARGSEGYYDYLERWVGRLHADILQLLRRVPPVPDPEIGIPLTGPQTPTSVTTPTGGGSSSGGGSFILGKSSATITKGSSGSVTAWEGAIGFESATTTVYSCYARAQTIDPFKFVYIVPIAGGPGYDVIPAECS